MGVKSDLKKIVEKFRDDHCITCAESIYQTDKIQVDALEFVEELIQTVGYVGYLGDKE